MPFHGRSDLMVFGDVVARRSLPLRPEASIPIASSHGDHLWELLTLCWAYEPTTRPEVTHVLDEVSVNYCILYSDLVVFQICEFY